MKIVFCITSLGIGGAERVITNLANEMCKDNNVTVIVSKEKNEKYSLDSNVQYVVLDDKKYKNKIIKYCHRISKNKKIIKEINPDIIVTFLPEPCIRMSLLRKYIKSKVILAVRDDPKIDYKRLLYKIPMKLFFNRADAFVFQTNEQKLYFNKKIQNKSKIIFNPINEKFIREPYPGKRNNKIINSGRLSTQKNQKLLIDAFSIVNKKYPNFELHIFGKDDNKKLELENQIKNLNLESKVFLRGVSNDMANEIYDARLFALSSYHEGLPNALLEAMASGVPCVSVNFSGGGAEAIIKNKKNGLLVDSNAQELADAIIFCLENEKIANNLGINAAKDMKKYTPSNITKKWINYIEEVMGDKNEKIK